MKTKNELIQEQLDKDPGHDRDAHGGLSARQTGFREGCPRCDLLKAYDEKAVKEGDER